MGFALYRKCLRDHYRNRPTLQFFPQAFIKNKRIGISVRRAYPDQPQDTSVHFLGALQDPRRSKKDRAASEIFWAAMRAFEKYASPAAF
jgi:hypothetical protein